MFINEGGAVKTGAAFQTQWTAFALCLMLLLIAQGVRAQIVSASATPITLPASGGNVTVQVVVGSATAVSSVAAYANGSYIGGLSANGTDGVGNRIYSGAFAVSANITNLPRSFVYTVAVTDTSNHVTNGPAGTVDQASPGAIQILSSTLSVNSLTAIGGTFTVSAVVIAPAPNAVNSLYVYANGLSSGGLGSLSFHSANADGSGNYSGTFPLPPNVTDAPHPYQIVLNGADNIGSTAAAVVGVVTVSNAAPASVVSSALSTGSLPATGGTVTVSAVISAPAPNDVYELYAFRFNSGLGALSYTSSNADQTKNFSGTFTFPANSGNAPMIYPVVMRLRDNASNSVTVPVGYVTVGGVAPIKILSVSASTTHQSAAGGSVTFSATVLAPAPNDVYDLYAFNYSQQLVQLTYQSANADGSKVFSGTYTNPGNASNATLVKDLFIRARDNAGNQATQPVGLLTVSPQTPIKILSATFTPSALTAAGGSMVVSATVLAPAPNDVQYVRVFRYDGSVGFLSYVSTNADGSKVYSGTFPVTSNTTNGTQNYPYVLYAYDNSNNYASMPLGSLTVPAVTPIKIVSAALSGTSVPAAGGNLTATVTLSAPAPNDVSSVTVYEYGSNIGALSYNATNGDGSKTYTGTITLPAQRGLYAETALLSVQARDITNNYVYTSLPNVTVGTAATNDPVTISNVSISKTSLPATGGNVIIKATLKPAVAGTLSSVQVYDYEFYQGNLIYQSTNADGSLNYANSFSITASTTTLPTQNSFQVVTILNGNDYSESLALVGLPSAASIAPVTIISDSLSTSAIPATGGDITINATTNSPTGNSLSVLYAYRNNGYIGRLYLQTNNADGTQNWSGSFSIDPNTSGMPLNDIYSLEAVDAVGDYVPATVGPAVVAAAGAPTINSAALSASSFPASGGEMIIMAVVTPAAPYLIRNVEAYSNIGDLGALIFLNTNPDGSENWIGSFPVAPNVSDAGRSDLYYLSSQDSRGNYVPYAIGSATVAPLGTLSAVAHSISATSFPAAGGNITLSMKVSPPAGDTGLGVDAYSNGVYLGGLLRQSTNADGTINYSGSFPVSPNVSDQPRTDYYYAEAYDSRANYANVSLGNVTVGPTTPISITQATLSTASLGVNGGDVILNLTTNAPLPNNVSYLYAYSNGQYVGNLTFQNANGDGEKNFSSSFHLAANSGVAQRSYLFTFVGVDAAGNIALGTVGSVAVDTLPATVAGKISLEALVGTAAAQTLTFQFRPKDGSAAFNLTASVNPDGFFNLLNIPRKNYDLWIKGPKNLAKVEEVNTLNSDAHNVTALLLGGDSNNDNSVDSTDFGLLIGVFGSSAANPGSGYDPTSDYNGDGSVDSTDFGILIGNFGAMGDK